MDSNISIVNVTDITDKFKSKLFDLKTDPALNLSEGEMTNLHRKAMKSITYMSNMYFYSNVCRIGMHLIEYKTQTTDEIIGDHSITFLN